MKFENSKFDNDKGVKEGSKADLKRDAREKKAMKKAGYAKGGIVPASKITRKAGGVSARMTPAEEFVKPKKPSTGRDQMIGGPGMPRLNKGGMLKKKAK